MSRPGRPHRLALLLVGTGTLLLARPALATSSPSPSPAPVAPEARALQLLTAAAQAASSLTYSGTQFVSTWHDGGATSNIADVRHQPGAAAVVSLRPTAGDSDDAAESAVSLASDLDPRLLRLLAEHFSLAPAGNATVIGRTARVVEALRDDPGAAAVAGKFWVDAGTGLVLRRESFDRAGRLVRSSAFTSLTVDPTRGPTAYEPEPPVLDRAEVDRLRRAGWQVPDDLPGDLELFDARLRTHAGQSVLHLSYSDGLSTLSLFAQHGRLGSAPVHGFTRERLAGTTVWVRDTTPERLVWGGGGRVFTLLSDAAPDEVRAAVTALPHDKAPRTGLVARLERGLKRLASWLNPFS